MLLEYLRTSIREATKRMENECENTKLMLGFYHLFLVLHAANHPRTRQGRHVNLQQKESSLYKVCVVHKSGNVVGRSSTVEGEGGDHQILRRKRQLKTRNLFNAAVSLRNKDTSWSMAEALRCKEKGR